MRAPTDAPNDRSSAPARILLRGHDSLPAHLEVARFPFWAWVFRTLARAGAWLGGTVLGFLLTWDPFVTVIPFAVGLAYTWKSFRGRYRVREFRGECPRCATPLLVRPGDKIDLPHPLVCYSCHHEPLLVLARG